MRRATRWLFGAAILVAAAGLPALAGKYNKALDVGAPAPQFSGLEAVDGKTYGLSDFAEKDAVVVVFTCNHCPVAQAYNERFNEFVADYKDKPVGFLAINVDKGESLDAMKKFAKEEDLDYPYAYDETQKSGKSYGASVTPHVFVLNKDRKIAYMGAWDDSPMNPDKVEKNYARDAVEAILAGRTPEVAETQQVGCGIRYE
ncbi:MAG TPA: thioredoxin family protein [Planctomycetaceae bacterium]